MAVTKRLYIKRWMRRQNTNSKAVIRTYDPEKIPNPIVHELNQYDKSIAIKILAKINVSKGGTTGTVVDGKIIMKHAIEMPRCCGIVLGHNHPSGNLRPSEADIKITHKLKEIASFIDINLVDHIIVGENAYYSFADEGMLR